MHEPELTLEKKKKRASLGFPSLAERDKGNPKGARRSQRADVRSTRQRNRGAEHRLHPSSLQASSLKEAKRADRAEALT